MTIDNAHGNVVYNFNTSKYILRRRDETFLINYKPKTNHLSVVFKIKKLGIGSEEPLTIEETLDLHTTQRFRHTWYSFTKMVSISDNN